LRWPAYSALHRGALSAEIQDGGAHEVNVFT